jgi:hypothetical protein
VTEERSLSERTYFVEHKGQSVFVIDFSGCTAKEILLLLDQVQGDVTGHEPGSMLVLADFAVAEVDKDVATKIKKVLVLDRPYVKRAAWIGTESLPHVFYENFKSFSQRELPLFKTREEALDSLVAE